MAEITGSKISALSAVTSASDANVLAGVQGSVTKKFPLSVIRDWIRGWISKIDVGLGNVDNVLQYSASNKPTATDVTYDGTTSGLSAATAQGAIDEVEGVTDTIAADLATVESSSTASVSHAVGSYLVLGGVLYRVTTAIAAGETITPGTNVAATTVTGITDGITAMLGGVVLGVYEVPANTTRNLSFVKEVKGGTLIMSGGVSSKRGMYIYSSTSTGSVGVTAVLAVAQSGLSIAGSGDDIVVVNGSNALFICVIAYKGALPTLTEPT